MDEKHKNNDEAHHAHETLSLCLRRSRKDKVEATPYAPRGADAKLRSTVSPERLTKASFCPSMM